MPAAAQLPLKVMGTTMGHDVRFSSGGIAGKGEALRMTSSAPLSTAGLPELFLIFRLTTPPFAEMVKLTTTLPLPAT